MKPLRILLSAAIVGLFFVLGSYSAEGTLGDIEGTIDSLEFDTSDAATPEAQKINSNYIAIVYEGVDSDGFIKTVRIEDNGDMGDAVVDTIEFDSSNCMNPDMIQLVDNENVYVIAYQGVDGDGWLATVEIFENGEITDSVVDSFEFDTAHADTPDLLHVSGDVYMIVYMGAQSDGWVATVEILDNGDITDPVIESFEADTTSGLTPHTVHYRDNIFIVAYEDTGSNGTLITFIVIENGDIQPPRIDDFVFDALNGINPDIHMHDNIVFIFYQGGADDGWITSVDLFDNGDINTELDSFEWDSSAGFTPDETDVSFEDPHVHAIAYEGPQSDGWLATITLNVDNGEFQDEVLSRFEFDTVRGEYPDITNIDGDTYVIVYVGEDGDGWVKSIAIQSTSDWSIIETWTGTVNAPENVGWVVIDNWTGTVNAPENVGWVVIDNWTGTVNAPENVGWVVIDSWTGTIEAVAPVAPYVPPPVSAYIGAAQSAPVTPVQRNLVLDIEVELLEVRVVAGAPLVAKVTLTNFSSYWNEAYVTGSIDGDVVVSEVIRIGADSQNEMVLEAVAPEEAGSYEFTVDVYYEESRFRLGAAVDTFEVVPFRLPFGWIIAVVIVAMFLLIVWNRRD